MTELYAFPHKKVLHYKSTMTDEPDGSTFAEPVFVEDGGMTLRDYFAAKAMQGFIANPDSSWDDHESVAKHSYEIADAMLKQREQVKEKADD